MDDISTIHFDEGLNAYSGPDFFVYGGYDAIPRGLIHGLDIDLRLGKVVTEIDYSLSNGVIIKMKDGS